jgi:hypothetical protein
MVFQAKLLTRGFLSRLPSTEACVSGFIASMLVAVAQLSSVRGKTGVGRRGPKFECQSSAPSRFSSDI